MIRRTFNGERWLSVQGWPYEVGSRGHIRRKRSKKLINPWWDNDGYGTVILQSGRRKDTVHLDALVASTFSGNRVNGKRPLHLNGLPWDNWPSNLAWGIGSLPYDNMTNLVINWTVWSKGRLQHGLYTDYRAVRAAASRIGDIIIGRNPKREIVSIQLQWSRDMAKSPQSPFDLVRKYQALASQHPNHAWALELAEAAQVILALAGSEVEKIPSPSRAATATHSAVSATAAINGGGIARRRVAPNFTTRNAPVQQVIHRRTLPTKE